MKTPGITPGIIPGMCPGAKFGSVAPGGHSGRGRRRRALILAAVAAALAGPAAHAVDLNPGDIIISTAYQGGASNLYGGSYLYHFNPDTAVLTPIGTDWGNTVQPSGLAIDENYNILVTTAYQGASGNLYGGSYIYRVDPVTGNRTQLGNDFGDTQQPSSIIMKDDGTIIVATAYDGGAGNLYGGSYIYEVDPDTGARTALGTDFGDTIQPAALAIRSDGKILAGTGYLGGSSNLYGGAYLYEVDPDTGTRIALGTDYGNTVQPSAMAFKADGTLLLGTAYQGDSGNLYGGAYLYEVDPFTGARTTLGTDFGDTVQPSAIAVTDDGTILLATAFLGGSGNLYGGAYIYEVDPDTGARTAISSDFGNTVQVSAMVVVPVILDFTGGNNLLVTDSVSGSIKGDPYFYSNNAGAVLDVDDLYTALLGGDAGARAGTGGANNQDGDVTFAAALDYDGVGTQDLTIRASDDIILNSPISDSDTGTADALNVELFSNNARQSAGLPGTTGLIDINAAIDAGAGTIDAVGQNFDNTSGSLASTSSISLDITEQATIGGDIDTSDLAVAADDTVVAGGVTSVNHATFDGDTFVQTGGSVNATGTLTLTQTSAATFGSSVEADTLDIEAPTVEFAAGADVSAGTLVLANVADLFVTGGITDVGSVDLSDVGIFNVGDGVFEADNLDLTQPGILNHAGGTLRVDGGTLTTGNELQVDETSYNPFGSDPGKPTIELVNGANADIPDGLNIGPMSGGNVRVLDGSSLTAATAHVGVGDTSTFEVAGPGSTAAIAGTLTIGAAGTVAVGDGAALHMGSLATDNGGVIAMSGGNLSVGTPILDLPVQTTLQGYGSVNERFRGAQDSQLTADGGTLTVGDSTSFTGFRTSGLIDVQDGATLVLHSRAFAAVGPLTTLDGGTIEAPNGLALGLAQVIDGHGAVTGRFAGAFGSTVNADGGDLALGDDASVSGFFSDGEIYTNEHAVTLLDANQAVLGSLTVLGTAVTGGTLNADNGILLEESKNLVGRGTVNADFENEGEVIGDGPTARIVFAEGFTVTGKGSLTFVLINGTYSPGDSPGIVTGSNQAVGGTIEIELGGPTAGFGAGHHDQINDDAFFGLGASSTLMVRAYDGFLPDIGDSFTLLTWESGLVGGLGSLAFDPFFLANGIGFDVQVINPGGAGQLVLTAAFPVIPEPATLGLLTLGAAAWLTRRRPR